MPVHGPVEDIVHAGGTVCRISAGSQGNASDLFVAMAAYGDYSPGYIPTADAFTRGGYEVEVARLDPSCETILMAAMSKLLKEGR